MTRNAVQKKYVVAINTKVKIGLKPGHKWKPEQRKKKKQELGLPKTDTNGTTPCSSTLKQGI